MKIRKISLKMPKGYSKPLHASVLFLTLFGLFMIISANANINAPSSASLVMELVKELGFIVLSYIGMVLVARNYKSTTLKRWYYPLIIITFISLLLPLGFRGVEGSNTHAWIRIGSVTIQPSEFAKIVIVLIMANSLGDKKNQKLQTWDLLTHPMLLIAAMVGIVVFVQRDFGSGLIMLGIAAFCGLVPSHRSLHKIQNFVFIATFSLMLLIYLSSTSLGLSILNGAHIPSYMIDRFRVSANPFLDRYGPSNQIFNGLAAFVQGNWFGVGYGRGFLKYSFIFAAETDSILAVIVEELGIVFGFVPILLGYIVMMYQLMKNALFVQGEKDRMILVGAVAYIFMHFFLNIGGITALIPLTGVPLLFISAGGSSRLAIMMVIGLSQNVIARHRKSIKALEEREII